MAIDKAQTPFMPDLLEEERLEIEVVNPEAVSIETDDGGVLIDFDPDNPLTGGMNHNSNLAEFIDDQELMDLSSELVAAYMSDKDSRKDWEDSYMKGLDLLGLKFEDRTIHWDGACGVFHPMRAEAVVRFQAQTIQEIYPAAGPVKTRIVGKLTDEKSRQSVRVENYLNYLITE